LKDKDLNTNLKGGNKPDEPTGDKTDVEAPELPTAQNEDDKKASEDTTTSSGFTIKSTNNAPELPIIRIHNETSDAVDELKRIKKEG